MFPHSVVTINRVTASFSRPGERHPAGRRISPDRLAHYDLLLAIDRSNRATLARWPGRVTRPAGSRCSARSTPRHRLARRCRTLTAVRRTISRRCSRWSRGAVGAALCQYCFDAGWLTRIGTGRAVAVTHTGQHALCEHLNLPARILAPSVQTAPTSPDGFPTTPL